MPRRWRVRRGRRRTRGDQPRATGRRRARSCADADVMSPAFAASITPRSEVWSQGCTTIAFAAVVRFAPAISRSYFDPDGAHQFVGMEAAFHQQLALAGPNQLDRLGGCGIAVGNIDQLKLADIELMVASDAIDLGGRPNEHRI